jgi:hypothetical protein
MTGMIPASFLKEGDSEESNSFEIFAKNSLAQKGLLEQPLSASAAHFAE